MPWPENNEGVGGLSFDEHDLLQSQTDAHGKTFFETSLLRGKPTTYSLPDGIIEGDGPYEIPIQSMADERTDLTSHRLYGKFQIKKISNNAETKCTTEDYSVVNLAVNR